MPVILVIPRHELENAPRSAYDKFEQDIKDVVGTDQLLINERIEDGAVEFSVPRAAYEAWGRRVRSGWEFYVRFGSRGYQLWPPMLKGPEQYEPSPMLKELNETAVKSSKVVLLT